MDLELAQLQLAALQAKLPSMAADKAVSEKNYARSVAQIQAQIAKLQADIAAAQQAPQS